MNQRMNQAVVGALPILARAISAKAGVRLVMNAACAQTDGQTIHLPPLPLDDPDTTALALGFIAHEAEHVRDTDMALFNQAAQVTGLASMLNALEDIRIERGAAARFPGLKSTLIACISTLKARGQVPTTERTQDLVADFLHLSLRVSRLGNTCLAEDATKFEAALRATTGNRFADDLMAMAEEIDGALSTADVLALARRILGYVKASTVPVAGRAAASESTPQERHACAQGSFDLGGLLGVVLGEVSAERGATDALVPDESAALADGDAVPLDFSAVKRSTIGLRARVERFLQAPVMSGTYPARSGRRLDCRRLWRITVGNGCVYQRDERAEAVDTAIVLLIDRSVSMGDYDRIRVAREVALSLCLALDRVEGLAVAAGAFPGNSDAEVWVAKPFGSAAQACASRFGFAASGSTPLTQALLWAGHVLNGRAENRRLAIVITDGEPDCLHTAKGVVGSLGRMGIEVMGLGIGLSVSHLFDASTVVADASDLAASLYDLLGTALQGRTQAA
jgi:cobalamin biosynthesis protein CobT